MSMCYAAQMHSVEFVFFAKDVAGTGRTMEVLRSNREIQAQHDQGSQVSWTVTPSSFLSFQTSLRGMLTQDAVSKECSLFPARDPLPGGVMV